MKKTPKIISEAKMKQAWNQQLAEDWMLEMNIVTPEYLNKVRMLLLIAFPLKQVDVQCDVNKQKMEFTITFDWWKSLLHSKNKIINKIKRSLMNNFPIYEIDVRITK